MDPFTLAGYNEQDVEALTKVVVATGISSETLIAALSKFAKDCTSAVDAIQELNALARTAQKRVPDRRRKSPLPRSLGNITQAAARVPARPVRYQNQRGRKR